MTRDTAASGRVEFPRSRARWFGRHHVRYLVLITFQAFASLGLVHVLDVFHGEPHPTAADFLVTIDDSQPPHPEEELQPPSNGESQSVVVWFIEPGPAPSFRSIERRIPIHRSRRALAEALVDELQAPPPSPHVISPLPHGTKVMGAFFDGGDLYLDLSTDVVRQHDGGTMSSWATLTALTATLSAIDGIRRVRFLVGGQERISLSGHFDLGEFWPVQPLQGEPRRGGS